MDIYAMLSKFLLVSFLCFTATWSSHAQCDFDPGSNGTEFRVRDVAVDALFGKVPRQLRDTLAKHRGEIFRAREGGFAINSPTSESSVAQFQAEVRAFLERKTESIPDASIGQSKKGGIYVRATFAVPCVKVVASEDCLRDVVDGNGKAVANCVDVVIKYTVIPVNTSSPVSNLLDLAHSNQLRFYRELPSALVGLDPSLAIENDITYGTSLVGSIEADLLSLPSTLSGKKTSTERRTTLLLTANGRKSLKLPLFSANTSLLFSRSRPAGRLTNVVIGGGYSTERDGLGSSILRKESANFRADAQLKILSSVVNQVTFGMDYRHRRSRLERVSRVIENSVENFVSSRVVTDGKLANGFLRAAAWIDHASPENGAAYSRFSTQIGYAKNFSRNQSGCTLGSDENGPICIFEKTNPPVVGLEMLFGLGRSWGSVPEHARFYGGNGGANFLYDSQNSSTLIEAPTGPLMRNIGRNRGGARYSTNGSIGGTSYEFLSTSLSIPIRSWSKPLIPPIAVIDRPNGGGCEECSSLKNILKNQVVKGKELYLGVLAWESLTEEQKADFALEDKPDRTPEEDARLARANAAYDEGIVKFTPKANAVWKEIMPTVGFIADKANLFSVKPLVMFDIARITARGERSARVRMGIGAGLQLNVVVAKFELGYVRTVRGISGEGGGNFVIRTVFEKLF
jgi:hypothetical protein